MSAKKSKPAKKSSSTSKSKTAQGGPVPPYGVPIREAIARGNKSEMKSLASSTRKYVADVQRALKVLEGKIAKHGG